MTKIISLVILQTLFCFTFPPITYSANSLIETTCKQTPFFDLCVSVLKSDPRGSTADVTQLALIMADSVEAKGKATLNQVQELLQTTTDPKLKYALHRCIVSYEGIVVADIPDAIDALKRGDPKSAVQCSSDAGNDTQRCEDGFEEKLPNSPISSSNKAVHDLSVVLQSIASLLH